MDRINQIFFHPLYQKHFQALQEAEKDRIFCNHTLAHFLDTARLMYIRALEEQAEISRELLYAAAFLHDIGRYEQIRNGIPHDIAGADLAEKILSDCEFSKEEIAQICSAISSHRQSRSKITDLPQPKIKNNLESAVSFSENAAESPKSKSQNTADLLSHYLYDADKQTRCCFSCPAAEECNWSQEKRNLQIRK